MSSAHHSYRVNCRWNGSTGRGYEHYAREHAASAVPAQDGLVLSADRAFLGRTDYLNPEQLLVMAASSCQLLSFLAVAARARVDVLSYDDHAEGVMLDDGHRGSISRISLRPRIVVASGPSAEHVCRLVDVAHRECYIANSLRTEVDVKPEIVIATS